jgi:hypothetical protein
MTAENKKTKLDCHKTSVINDRLIYELKEQCKFYKTQMLIVSKSNLKLEEEIKEHRKIIQKLSRELYK